MAEEVRGGGVVVFSACEERGWGLAVGLLWAY